MKRYEQLYFDLDHTLWDFDANSAVVLEILFHDFQLSEKLQVNFDEFRTSFEAINEKLWDRYRKGFINRETLRWKRFWLTMLEFKYANETLSRQLSDTYLTLLPQQKLLLPHAIEVLDYCAGKGYPMHIITNGFETTQYQKLQHAGIQQYFDKVITSEGSMSLKPHPAIYDYAMRHTGGSHASSLMIGDNWEVDILGAMNVGMDQVYYNPASKVVDGAPTFQITCLKELMEIL